MKMLCSNLGLFNTSFCLLIVAVYLIMCMHLYSCGHRSSMIKHRLNPKRQNNNLKIPSNINEANETSTQIIKNHSVIASSSGQPLYYSGMGQLGNQLFQFSSAFCVAVKANRTPVVYTESHLTHLFPKMSVKKVNKDDKMTYIRQTNAISFGEKDANLYNVGLLESVKSDKNSIVSGYHQSWKYFTDCEGSLRSQLKFNAKLKRNADRYMKSLANSLLKTKNISYENVTFIGIHVRRGDRSTHAAPGSYFKNAMQYFDSQVNYPLYIVVTDDIQWCKANIKTNETDNIQFSENTKANYMDDFVLLTLCKHFIITVGTFGWFAAWLSGGETVYYKDWLRDPEIVKDHFPSDWIGMV